MPLLVVEDFSTHVYAEIIAEITRHDDTLVEKAIVNAEGEAKAYLNRYDLEAMFVPTNPDEFLKSLVKDIACWHLIKLANPNINLELFRTAYEDAVKFFRDVMKGNADPVWPLKANDPATAIDDAGHVEWNSNTKRTSHY